MIKVNLNVINRIRLKFKGLYCEYVNYNQNQIQYLPKQQSELSATQHTNSSYGDSPARN